MNTTALEKALYLLLRYSNTSYYVIAANEINTVKYSKFPIAIIQNTDPIGKAGKHWLAYWIESEDDCEYFDSFGNPVTKYIHVTSPNYEIVKENCTVLQSAHSQVCGFHCLFFLCHRSLGIPYENILDKYTARVRYNDRMVKRFVENIPYFDLNNTVINGNNEQKCVCKADCPEFV